ncbi:MAG: alcohol dehydrogenase [Acidobacteria bacterium]|nr:MAG: alcohol dehydrogenase [Acidobacteriota bacterium]
MKALRMSSSGVAVEDVAKPEINDEALVRVLKSGICNTDLEIARGYAGFNGTIGHEFVGVVESSGDRPELVGKRVVGEINAGCGKCERCVAGDSRHCPSRTVLGILGRDGAHAEFLRLPSRNLVQVPDSVSDNAAVFAEPLAAAFGIGEQVEIGPETRVAVVGDGKLGLLCAMTTALRTNAIVLIGKHPEKMSIAGKRDIETVKLGTEAALAQSFDVVIEASGSESGFATALDLIKPRGKIVLKSTFHGTPKWEAARVVVDEITIVGSRCGLLAPAIDLLASKSVNVDDLVSDEYRLDDGVAALEQAGRMGVLKIFLRP